MKSFHAILSLVITAILPFAAMGAQKTFRLEGSESAVPIISKTLDKFKKTNKKTHLELKISDSKIALAELAHGKIDAALTSMEIPPGFNDQFQNFDFRIYPFARDAVIPAVSQLVYLSGVKDLSIQNLKDIYTGKVKNWKQLQGPDANIELITQKNSDETHQIFMAAIFGDSEPKLREGLKILQTIDEVQAAVAQSTAAMAALPMTQTKPEVRGCGLRTINGVLFPTAETIMNGIYPTARTLSLVTIGEPQGDLKAFINFLKGPESRAIIRELNFIPIW